ncbi:MAG TPA: DUF4397 domain-containing protein [Polyangiaceae bacterium]
MRPRAAFPLAAALVCASMGCTRGRSAARADAGAKDDAASSPPDEDGADDAGGDATDEDAAPTQAFVRIAQASPDAPSLDVCVAPHGSGSFEGPLLAQLAVSLAGDAGAPADAAAPGLAYAQVSAYVALDPGAYDVRVVAAGNPCASLPLLPDRTDLPALAAGTYATLLLAGETATGDAGAPIGLTALFDDATLPGGGALLRAVNAAPEEPLLDFGLGEAATWLPVLTNVGFGAASAQTAPGEGSVDANGYVPADPTAPGGQAFSARVSSSDAGTNFASAGSVAIDLGAIATLVAIGRAGDAAHPPALLVCIDDAPAGGLLADCSVATP